MLSIFILKMWLLSTPWPYIPRRFTVPHSQPGK